MRTLSYAAPPAVPAAARSAASLMVTIGLIEIVLGLVGATLLRTPAGQRVLGDLPRDLLPGGLRTQKLLLLGGWLSAWAVWPVLAASIRRNQHAAIVAGIVFTCVAVSFGLVGVLWATLLWMDAGCALLFVPFVAAAAVAANISGAWRAPRATAVALVAFLLLLIPAAGALALAFPLLLLGRDRHAYYPHLAVIMAVVGSLSALHLVLHLVSLRRLFRALSPDGNGQALVREGGLKGTRL